MDEDWQIRKQSTPFWLHLAAGSIAGLTQHLSMLPIDNLKTHWQSSLKPQSIIQTLTQIYKRVGIIGFYSGSSVMALGCVPAHGAYFSIYQLGKTTFGKNASALQDSLTGAFAVLVHDLIMTPSQMIKQRTQLLRSISPSTKVRKVVSDVVKYEGFRSLFRSFWVNYSMNIPFGALLVPIYERIKRGLRVQERDSILWYCLSGGIAGFLAAIPTTPLDVIKTKINTHDIKLDAKPKPLILKRDFPVSRLQVRVAQSIFAGSKGMGVLGLVSKVIKEEGWGCLMRGVCLRSVMISASSSISWGTYQFCCRKIRGLMAM